MSAKVTTSIKIALVLAGIVLAAFVVFPKTSLAADPSCPAGENWNGIVCVKPNIPVTVGGIPATTPTPGSVTEGTRSFDQQQQAQRDAAAAQRTAQEQQQFSAGQVGQTDPPPDCGYDPVCNTKAAFAEISKAITDLLDLWKIAANAGWFIFSAAKLILWLGAFLLNSAIYWLVINMGSFINNDGANGIRVAWGAIRDLGNIAIIAGLVFIAISTIINYGNYQAKQFLTKIIIAALLINFSYFFAGAIIDASNIVSVAIYNSKLMTSGCATSGNNNLTGSGCNISESFLNKMKLDTWDQLQEQGQASAAGGNVNKQVFFLEIFGSIFLIVTAIVFFGAAFLLIGRFVALIILLITSPIGIAGMNIPFVSSYAQRWWSALFSQAFFAPVYLILVAISFSVMDGIMKGPLASQMGEGSYGNLVGTEQGAAAAIPLFLSFMIGIGFMWYSLVAAKSMANSTKDFSGIYNLVAKSQAFTGRNTFGRLGGGLADLTESRTYKNLASIPIIGGAFRAARSGALYAGSYKFGGAKEKSFADAKNARKKSIQETFDYLAKPVNAADRRDAAIRADSYINQKTTEAILSPVVGVAAREFVNAENKKKKEEQARQDANAQGAEMGLKRVDAANEATAAMFIGEDKAAHDRDYAELHEILEEERRQGLDEKRRDTRRNAMRRIEEREEGKLTSINEDLKKLNDEIKGHERNVQRLEVDIRNPGLTSEQRNDIQTKLTEARKTLDQRSSDRDALQGKHDTIEDARRKRDRGTQLVSEAAPQQPQAK